MRKSKKSPKEKQKTTKPEPPPKKDPVQYVSETGDGFYHCIAGVPYLFVLCSVDNKTCLL